MDGPSSLRVTSGVRRAIGFFGIWRRRGRRLSKVLQKYLKSLPRQRTGRRLARRIVQEQEYVRRWCLHGPLAEERAVKYLRLLQQPREYVVCVQCKYHYRGRPVVLALCSTQAATIRQRREYWLHHICDPPYMEYHAYFCEGMSFGDVHGMHEDHPDSVFLGSFAELLEEVRPDFQLQDLTCFPQREGQRYFAVLREVLHDVLGIPCWLEVSACRSFVEYRGLDLHWTLRTGIDGPDEVSWWMLNTSQPPSFRRDVHPGNWRLCGDYRWVGRTEWYADYDLWMCPRSSVVDAMYPPLSPLETRGVRAGILARAWPGFPQPYPLHVL